MPCRRFSCSASSSSRSIDSFCSFQMAMVLSSHPPHAAGNHTGQRRPARSAPPLDADARPEQESGSVGVSMRGGDMIRRDARRSPRLLIVLIAAAAALSLAAPCAAPATTPTWRLRHYTKVGYVHSFKLDLIGEMPAPPQLMMIGGSRTTRLEPSLMRQLTGLSTMNCAVSNCEPEDVWAFANYLYERAPDVKLRCLWGVQVRGISDVTFAQGLAYDTRLARWFPQELIDEQKALIRKPVVKDLLASNRYTARGQLTHSIYDRQRERGLTLSGSLDRWIPVHVRKEKNAAALPTVRARAYFEATMALFNEHGVTPCIVIMPYHPRALQALSAVAKWKANFEGFKTYLKDLRATYDFQLLNYTRISSFGGHAEWFYDGAHVTVENSRILLRHAVKAAPESFR